MAFEFIERAPTGQGTHRSGWPYALRALKRYCGEGGELILDDFVERSFLSDPSSSREVVHLSPWIGFCHHPPEAPAWCEPHALVSLQRSDRWRASFPHLKLVFTLADNLTEWVGSAWSKPCVTLRHPTVQPKLQWTLDRFLKNSDKKLVQIGSYLRNTHAIYQVVAPEGLRKVRLVQDADWVDRVHMAGISAYPTRSYSGVVEDWRTLGPSDYDKMLSENVVFIELIAAVANNTIVECMARNTPIVVNRLDGPIYYLGADYPLFFSDLREVPSLLTEERIIDAHRYLRRMDKSWMSGRVFAANVMRACATAGLGG